MGLWSERPRVRRATGLVLSLALLAGLRAAGMDLSLAEVVGLAVAGNVVWWVAVDLLVQSEQADWRSPVALPRRNRGRDHRLSYLTKLLGQPDLTQAHRALCRLADLALAPYAVSLDDDRARELLGDRIHQFLTAPPVGSPTAYHRQLPAVLTRIEEL